MGSFVFHDKPFTSKLSEQNDYPEVVKIQGCHSLLKSCHNGCNRVSLRWGTYLNGRCAFNHILSGLPIVCDLCRKVAVVSL